MKFKLCLLIFHCVCLMGNVESFAFKDSTQMKKRQEGRIIGGTNTTIAKHPYMLSLQYFSNHMCGATAISEYWALTAAHCFGATEPLMDFVSVRAGTSFHNKGGTEYPIEKIIKHEKFTPYDNDIALLKLKEPLKFSQYVRPIAMPEENADVKPGTIVMAMGWGKTETDDYLTYQLKEVQLVTMSQDDCTGLFGDKLTPRMLCAHYPGTMKDSCNGDSGGPLVVNNNLQVGIVSWGSRECGHPDFPGVYTRISSFKAWVKKHTGIN